MNLRTLPRLAAIAFSLATFPLTSTTLLAQLPAPAPVPTPAPAPTPDTLVFTNGDTLKGQLERGVADSIVFKADMTGEITVPLSKVKALQSSGSFIVIHKNTIVRRGEVHAGTISVEDGNVIVANVFGPPESMPIKDVGFILDQATFDKEVEREPGILYGINATVTGGANFQEATTYGGTFNVGFALARIIPTVPYLAKKNRTTLNVSETYGNLTTPTIPQPPPPAQPIPDSVVKTSVFHADAERDQYISPKYFVYGTVSFDHNFSQGLQLQSQYGGGIGWTPFSTPKHELDIKADVHYESQGFQDPTGNQNLVGSSFTESYRRTLPRKMIFTESATIVPAWNNFNAYSGVGNVGLIAPVFKRLAINFNTVDNFLNDPSPGYRKNSFQFIAGITYTLH